MTATIKSPPRKTKLLEALKQKKNSLRNETKQSFLDVSEKPAEAEVVDSTTENIPNSTPEVILEEIAPPVVNTPFKIERLNPISVSPAEKVEDVFVTPAFPGRPASPQPFSPPFSQTTEFNTEQLPHPNETYAPYEEQMDEDDIIDRVNTLMNDSNRIDYQLESDEIKTICKERFKEKFKALATAHPERDILFPEDKGLNKIHDTFHEIMKDLYVTSNLGQFQLGYIVILCFLEFIGVKALGIKQMSGFASKEVKRLRQYRSLLFEVGETFYSMSGGSLPLEWRILGTIILNIVLFIIVKAFSEYIGGDSDFIRKFIDDYMDSGETESVAETKENKEMDSNLDVLSSLLSFLTDDDKEKKKPKGKRAGSKKAGIVYE
jgi:hypothetical protein